MGCQSVMQKRGPDRTLAIALENVTPEGVAAKAAGHDVEIVEAFTGTMGHAGAIIGGAEDTAAAKMKIMEECGVTVVESPAEIGEVMVRALKK